MRYFRSPLGAFIFIAVAGLAQAASSTWGFEDGSLTVQAKGTGVGAGAKEKYGQSCPEILFQKSFLLSSTKPLPKPVKLGATDTLKISLTATEDRKPKQPHQVFLAIKDSNSGLETSYAFSVKENGKSKAELTHKEIPGQLLAASQPLKATLIIASFDNAKGLISHAFDLNVASSSAGSSSDTEKPLRYGKLPEIHHIFRADPKSPPKIISLVFTAAVVAALPILFIVWITLGANTSYLSLALSNAPISHTLFFGSIVALEAIFFLYYTSWNLFQTLPAAAAVGSIAFFSGSRALTEVQKRRLNPPR
ncbi:MAG: hypothetical protein M1825_005249 [Sarcosagium campestre]|nr:MAG: hypothetical protein M1825_005249 [Sarcosagium campestre]